MELINQKVKHRAFGEGTIISVTDTIVEIEFSVGVKRLQFPQTFESLMVANDSNIQSAIIELIKEKRDAAEAAKKAAAAERERIAEIKKEKASVTTKPKFKSLDDMFSEDYHVSHLSRHPILTYQQVEEKFGIKISGFGRGINPTSSTIVLISSIKKTDGNFVYHDKWTKDGDYIYSGEGKLGNQTLTKGNLAIKNAASDGKEIHLFVKFSPQEYYYQGVFELVDYTYEDDKDEDGNIRKEYKFRLKRKIDD